MPGLMLEGVKIIDLTTTVAGPACSQFLCSTLMRYARNQALIGLE